MDAKPSLYDILRSTAGMNEKEKIEHMKRQLKFYKVNRFKRQIRNRHVRGDYTGELSIQSEFFECFV
jgi:hypothetical protein